MSHPVSCATYAIRRPSIFTTWCLRLVAAACLVWAVPNLNAVAAPTQAETEQSLERRVKAAFLFRFTEFITWPANAFTSPDQPFVMAVIGSDGFVEELRQVINGRTIQGRRVEVRKLGANDALAGEELVFISSEERKRLPQIARTVLPGTLIVTEWEGATQNGSVINFVIADNRVRFEIALTAAERLGLRLSSRLLAVALAVHTGTP